MSVAYPDVSFELFGNDEATDLLLEMMHGGDFEDVRPAVERSPSEVEEQVRQFVDGTLPGDQLHWAIRETPSGQCIGSLQVTLRDSSFFVAYQIAARSRGAGKATQALRWLLLQLRSMAPEVPICATVNERNAASMRVLSKNGFVQDHGGQRERLFRLPRDI